MLGDDGRDGSAEDPAAERPASSQPPPDHPTDVTSSMDLGLGEGATETTGPVPAPVPGVPTEVLAPGTALIVVERGPNAGSRYLLDTDTTTVGRSSDADILLDDVTVSRHHAEFRRDGAVFRVHDVGSLNGTYVNRASIESALLASGDVVQIGRYRLLFLSAQPGNVA